jgi:hypothetical protein
MEKYRIGVFGEIEEVYISFFDGMEVLRQELIGDTWFICIVNDDGTLTFSIHDNYWQKVQVDLRNLRIDEVLGR